MDNRKLKKFEEEHKAFYWIKACGGDVFKIKKAFEVFIGGESEIIALDGDKIELLTKDKKALLFSNYEEAVNKAKELRKQRLELLDKAIDLVFWVTCHRPVGGTSDAYAKRFKHLVDNIKYAYESCVSDGLIKSDSEE